MLLVKRCLLLTKHTHAKHKQETLNVDDITVKDITTIEGKAIENSSSQFGLHQVINEPLGSRKKSHPSGKQCL